MQNVSLSNIEQGSPGQSLQTSPEDPRVLADQINGFTDEHNELESIQIGGERTEMNSTQ